MMIHHMAPRLVLAALIALSPLQEPGDDRIPGLLDKAEKLGMAIPDLSQACSEIELAVSRGSRLKPEWSHRLQVLQSRAAVAAALHRMFTESVGQMREMPLIGGKKDKVKVVEVGKKDVGVLQGSVKMTLGFADFDPEWTAAAVQPLLPPEPESLALHLGLFLAQAARWEAAGRYLGKHASDHPLAVETRRRAGESLQSSFDKSIAGKKWAAAFDLVKRMEDLDSSGDKAASAKEKLHDALVEHARDCALKKDKTGMNAAIALLEKHFPEEKELAAQIRDEQRWIILGDPKLFELPGKVGGPFVLTDDVKEGYSRSAYCQKDQGACDGLAARITVKDLKGGAAGFAWQSGLVNLWLDHNAPGVGIGSLNAERQIQEEWSGPVDRADAYDISVIIEKGEYVVRVNGKEAGRCKSKFTVLGNFCIKVTENTATFERVRIRKKS
jgi:hypothetical protein